MIKNDDIPEVAQESEDEDWEDEITDHKEQKEEAQILISKSNSTKSIPLRQN